VSSTRLLDGEDSELELAYASELELDESADESELEPDESELPELAYGSELEPDESELLELDESELPELAYGSELELAYGSDDVELDLPELNESPGVLIESDSSSSPGPPGVIRVNFSDELINSAIMSIEKGGDNVHSDASTISV